MGCIYNGVCSSLVALFLWQQVTNLAAVISVSLCLCVSPLSSITIQRVLLVWKTCVNIAKASEVDNKRK